jgi:hypothetical protein
MKPITLCLILLFIIPAAWSQSLPDTLNRFDSKQRKTGYWLTYLDSNLVKTEKSTAVYGGYEYYLKGKVKSAPFAKKNKWEGATIVYEPKSTTYLDSALILDGEVRGSYDDTLYFLQRFEQGKLKYLEEHLYGKDRGITRESTDAIYLDSLFENKPFTMLLYNSDDDKEPEYKQYSGKGIHEERVYLVPHTTKRILNAPRIGYTYQERSFLELGYSRKYSSRTEIEETGTVHYDNNNFPGFTVSLLGSWSEKRGNYFGQKALFSYCLTLINTETGFVNYTNFQTNDLRFTIGTGLSIAGRVSLMYHYSLPVLSNSFSDISRHSISLVLF